MLIGEQPEVRPVPVHAIVLPAPEAIVRTPRQRRRYILRQDVAQYGSTPGCEACAALAGGAQRVTKPHSDECRTRMDELMQRDEDALVQQRLHADRPRSGSTIVGASGDERKDPDVETVGSGLPSGSSAEAPRVGGAQESRRTGTEAAERKGNAGGSDEPMETAPEDAETRRGLKISAELPPEDQVREVCGRGEHLDDDVPTVTPIAQQTERTANAANVHMSVGKMEMIPSEAATMNSAVACELTSAEIWTLAKTAMESFGASVSRFAYQFTCYSND